MKCSLDQNRNSLKRIEDQYLSLKHSLFSNWNDPVHNSFLDFVQFREKNVHEFDYCFKQLLTIETNLSRIEEASSFLTKAESLTSKTKSLESQTNKLNTEVGSL